MMPGKFKIFLSLLLVFILFLALPKAYATLVNPTPTEESKVIAETKVFIATVIDAGEIDEIQKTKDSNQQPITLSVDVETSSGIRNDRIDTIFTFPNSQFKKPLLIGDQILIESTKDLTPESPISFISYYRQNNIIIWSIILLCLFLIVSGFKNNLKYIQIFLIFLVSGLIVLFFYRRSTYLTFGLLFLWQIFATYLFAFRIFTRKVPSIILTMSVFINQILALVLAFAMTNINLFDTGLFDVFFPTINNAREVMIYIFAVIVTYPISVVFAEQVITESIRKKREDNDITKINLMKHLARSALKSLNYIFLTFFGLFFAIFVSVIALGSNEDYLIQSVNSSSLSQMLSIGFLILFSILIFIPLVSAATGVFLGRLESHELVTDINLKQLEL